MTRRGIIPLIVLFIISTSIRSINTETFKIKPNYDGELKTFQSTLKSDEKEFVDSFIKLKNDLLSDSIFFNNLPKYYYPESNKYNSDLTQFCMIFIYLGIFTLALVTLFIVFRFTLKKCKITSANKGIDDAYTKSTWFLFGLTSIIMVVSIVLLIVYSSITLNKIQTNFIGNLKSVNNENKDYLLKLTTFRDYLSTMKKLTNEDNEYFKISFQSAQDQTTTTDDNISKESTRNKIFFILQLALCGFYIIPYILCIISYKKLAPRIIKASVIVALLIAPMICFLQFSNFSMFFNINDYCNMNYQSIYVGTKPVYNKGIGYLTNCFNGKIQEDFKKFNAKAKLVYDSLSLDELNGEFKDFLRNKDQSIDPLLNCDAMNNGMINNERVLCFESNKLLKVVVILNLVLLGNVILIITALLRLYEIIKKKYKEKVDHMRNIK